MPFDRPFARYFTTTHLYNAGESPEALSAYHVALSKLANSLSWGFQIINPQPIDLVETIFYIDLRDYEWDTRDAWTQIENVYPYAIEFDPDTQAGATGKTGESPPRNAVRGALRLCGLVPSSPQRPFPPLYHDILALPEEPSEELERELGIDVARNLQSAPGGTCPGAPERTNSGVSN